MKYNEFDFIEYGCENMNIFKRFYYCLFSAKKMAYMRFQPLSKTFLIIFMLNLITLAPIYFITKSAYDDLIQVQLPEIKEKIPPLTVSKGVLTTPDGKEQTINQGIVSIKISPDETTSTLNLDSDQFGIQFLKRQVVFSALGNSTKFDYSTFMGDSFTDKDIKDALDLAIDKGMYTYTLYLVFAFLTSFVFKLLEITLYAGITYLLGQTMRKALPFKQVWNICTFAFVIPSIFFAIMDSFLIAVPYGSFIFSLTTIFIIFQIYKEIPAQTEV